MSGATRAVETKSVPSSLVPSFLCPETAVRDYLRYVHVSPRPSPPESVIARSSCGLKQLSIWDLAQMRQAIKRHEVCSCSAPSRLLLPSTSKGSTIPTRRPRTDARDGV